MPALNEEKNLREAVQATALAFLKINIDWEIIVVDDGSADNTGTIAEELARQEKRIKVLHHQRPLGIGRSFRDGAIAATKEAVTYLPGDNENNPYEVIKYIDLLKHVDIVVPFVINKQVRPKLRQFLSALYIRIINFSFGTSFNYTNGNIIYKKTALNAVKVCANSFFFQTEYLLRTTQAGFTFAEVPIRILGRQKGKSKALSLKSLFILSKEFFSLLLSNFLGKL